METAPIDSLSPTPDAASRWHEQWLDLREGLSRRAAGIGLTLILEAALIGLLLTLGLVREEAEPETVPITTFDVGNPPPAAPEEVPADASAASTSTIDQPLPDQPAMPDLELVPLVLPRTQTLPVPPPVPRPAPSPSPTIGVRIREGSSIGPADSGSSRGQDSAVVGTAPDGSPLYAARWYREPRDSELAGYLSTASSTGWGLIACKTAPGWRVVDCEVVDEYPQGSGIARATQAAAWQFLVRPPRVGGQYQVGSWVRIRIDYTRTRRTS